jgi:hypothetical protein
MRDGGNIAAADSIHAQPYQVIRLQPLPTQTGTVTTRQADGTSKAVSDEAELINSNDKYHY